MFLVYGTEKSPLMRGIFLRKEFNRMRLVFILRTLLKKIHHLLLVSTFKLFLTQFNYQGIVSLKNYFSEFVIVWHLY